MSQYEQVAGTALYEINVAGTVGWAGYVLPESKNLPRRISFVESLSQQKGSYVFAVARPPVVDRDPAGFAQKVNDCVRDNARYNRALFWLRSISPVDFGTFGYFGVRFNHKPTPIQDEYILQSDLNAGLGKDLNFFVLRGAFLSVDEEKQALVLSIRNWQPKKIGFGFQKGNHDVGIEVGNCVRIPVSGTNAACLVFPAQVSPQTTFSPTQGLEAGFKYVVHDKKSAQDKAIYYAGFDVAALPATLDCVFAVDPSDPVNSRLTNAERMQGCLRTGFAILDTPSLVSTLRTAEGQPVSLLPLGASAETWTPPLMAGAVALASSSQADTEPGQADTYFTPAGKFGISVSGQDAGVRQQLLCGLFGTERLHFVTYDEMAIDKNDSLFFLVSQPAYAPVFPFETADLNRPASGNVTARLTDDYRAAWATIFQAASGQIDYSAEPDGSPLYGIDDTAPGAVLFSSPPSMPLPQGANQTFPMVSYGQISNPGVDGNTLTQFESQIIAATRKTRISTGAEETWQARESALLNLAGAEPDWRTTPQGFVTQVDATTGAYLNVAMAQSLDRLNNVAGFAFDKPTRQLQDALQTNQLFLVAVNDQYLVNESKRAVFDNVVYMAGWKMTAQVGNGATPTSYRNVMIFKFCEGSLVDRVTNPNRWTSPADFSLVEGSDGAISALAYTGLSQWLQNYIAEGIARADGPSGDVYKDFKKIVTDAEWRGAIVLEADLSAEDLPPEIQGLAAGIDFTYFTAHHFGFTVSRVSVDKNTRQIAMEGVSSLFGLVDYMDPAYALNLASGVNPDTPIPVQTSDDFDFTVLQLQSLFENARLVRFESHVQLTVDRLFASPVLKTYSQGAAMPANGVVFDGSYVDQNGEPSYVFQQTRASVFALDGNVLPAVAFSRVQFNTLGPRDGGATIASRFLIWGAFDFVELKDASGELLDVLSFGSLPGADPSQLGAGLAYSNLLIDMTFPMTTPNAKNFVLDTDNMAYDLSASQVRPDSLFHGFGLQLKTFINALGDKMPADYGYLPVTSGLNLTSLEKPWFGVVYEVTLGGPGALASAGGFNSNLLMAWSPTTKPKDSQHAVFLGLSLPGAAPGASLFSIEGVFKVAVGSIAILRQVVPTTPGSDVGDDDRFFYCLRLDDIGIKILGIVKLPPDANIQFFLFGDPNNTGALGWYAAYVAKDNPGCDQQKLGFATVSSQPAGGE